MRRLSLFLFVVAVLALPPVLGLLVFTDPPGRPPCAVPCPPCSPPLPSRSH